MSTGGGGGIAVGGHSDGPYHRRESPTQTSQDALDQAATMEIWGKVGRMGGLHPTVRAYAKSLPQTERGVEFRTQISPDKRHSTPWEVHWILGVTPGVLARRKNGVDFAAITLSWFSNRQP